MLNIVYLDDELELTNIFKILFKNTEHQVFTFTQVKDALEHCLKSPPDILFVDYRLEDARGDEVAMQLPEQVHKILVTGELKIENKQVFDAIIHKPFKLSELLKAVESVA